MKFLRFAILLFIMLIGVKPALQSGILHHLSNIKKQKTAVKQTAPDAKLIDAVCPLINDSQLSIVPSTCNGSDGEILGITGSGTGNLRYFWYSNDKAVVGTNADLTNVPAGVYTLQLLDDGKCTTTKKQYTIGIKNDVSFDDTNTKITGSDCSTANGSITGIIIQNAVKYAWYGDENNDVLATTTDLKNVRSGNYTLIGTNADGCQEQRQYSVPSTAPFPPIVKIDTIGGECGGVAVDTLRLFFNPAPSNTVYTYYVLDDSGAEVMTGGIGYNNGKLIEVELQQLAPNSVYTLYMTDPNECRIVAANFKFAPKTFSIVTDGAFIRNDACGRHTGSISGIKLIGGKYPNAFFGNPPPQAWTWTDSTGNVVGHFPDLQLIGKGKYTVVVKDIAGCSDTKTFMVGDTTSEAEPPKVDNVTLCLPATIMLSVINPDKRFKYRIYDSTQTPLTENSPGIFQETVTQTSKFYVTTLNSLCESNKTPVTVTVVAPGVVIPNTFTPNNDGVNDYWTIPHIADFPGAEIFIYSRDGQQIYHSINYSHLFDGKLNGKALPVSVYYYTIDLKQPQCLGKISGSLTLVR